LTQISIPTIAFGIDSLPHFRSNFWHRFICLTINAALLLTLRSEEPNYVLRSWKTTDGLPQNSIDAIAETPDGYLWLGTRGGLARFDGVNFTHFGLGDGLNGGSIVDLLNDGRGSLWMASFGGGLSQLKDGKITTFTTAEGLAHDYTTFLEVDKIGIWIGGVGGLQHYGENGFTNIGEAEGLPAGEIIDMTLNANFDLWIAVAKGLFLRHNGEFAEVKGPNNESIVARSLLSTLNGSLWVSKTGGKLLRLQNGLWTEFNESHGLPSSFVNVMENGSDGDIWFGTYDHELFVFRENQFHPVLADQLSSIRSLHCSKNGLLWVGSRTGGLGRLSTSLVDYHPVGDAGATGQVCGILEDTNNTLWATTYGSGLFKGKPDDIANVEGIPSVDGSPYLLSCLKVKSGALYFNGLTYLVKVEPTGETREIKIEGFAMALCEGKDGCLWIGTREGKLMNLVNDVIVPISNNTFPAALSSIVCGGGSDLWISTQGAGLFNWDAGKVRQWLKADGLPVDVIRPLYRDSDDTLWIGTGGGGLAWMKDDQIHFVNAAHGIDCEFVSQILEDDSGNLWLGTYRGILRVSKRELFDIASGKSTKIHPLTLGESDGMTDAECTGGYCPAGLRSESGTLYFSTVRGIVAVAPQKFTDTKEPPPVQIERISLNGDLLPNQINPSPLPAGLRELEFHFTAFDYLKPEKLRFRYKLDGYESIWVDAGTQRLARYPLVPPGNYVFQVTAAGSDGVWNESAAQFAFEVLPFYWQTPWFRVSIAVLIMLLSSGVVALMARTRIKKVRAASEEEQRKQEVAQLTRLAILGKQSAAIAHELSQPLTAIMSNAQAAQRFLEGSADPQEIRDILADIVSDDHRASEVIKRVRMLLQKGAYEPTELEPIQLIRQVVSLLDSDLKSRKVKISISADEPIPTIRGDRVQLQQVFINLISNACDAMETNENGDRIITITVRNRDDATIQISLADNGSGIIGEEQESVFETYHTNKKDGLGLGLSLSRSIIQAHLGRIWAENNTGCGATFHIVLPQWKGARQ
jgi:signal transduction histidine kinase/ligand-binding sensor domain-containing protein